MTKLNGIWIICVITFLVAKAEDGLSADSSDEIYYDYSEEYDFKNFSIATEPKVLEVDIGETVEFPCSGSNLQHFAMLWQKGNALLSVGEEIVTDDRRFSLLSESNELTLENVTVEDTGDYTCKIPAVAPAQQKYNVTHTLRVKPKPGDESSRVSVQSSNRIAKDGERVTLSCNVTGYPHSAVTWERKGKESTRTQGDELIFASVSRRDAGTYECTARNDLGTTQTLIRLIIAHLPEIQVHRASVNKREGDDIDLICKVYSEPKAHVVWYKDGYRLTSSIHIHETDEEQGPCQIVTVRNIQESDLGNYSCVADNSFGKVVKSILFSETPSQPRLKNEYMAKDHKSYTLVWSLESAVNVEEFKIKFKRNEEDWQEMTVPGEKGERNVYTVSYTFRGLSLSSHYEVTLAALNQYGWSLEAQSKKFNIDEEYRLLESDNESESGSQGMGVWIGSGCMRLTPSFLSLVLLALTFPVVILKGN